MDSFQVLSSVFPLSGSLYLIQAPNQARFLHANGVLFTGKETVLVDASPFYQNRFPDRRIQRVFETQPVAKNLQQRVDDGRVVFSRETCQKTHRTSIDNGSG